MAAVSVTFDGQRANDAEATTNWTAATATPTLEPDFRYQSGNCISAQVKTSQTGFYFRNSAVTWNFSSPKRVWVAKVIATNKDALDGNGLILEIGSGARTAYYTYNVYSATTYPIAGGFQIIPIDPNVSGYRSNTVGSPTITAIDMFGVQADFNVIAKAANVGVDAIDIVGHGDGLSLTGGDGADADGTFDNFTTTDEGTTTNRWGIVSTRDGVLYVVGTLSIGSGSAAFGFTDSNKVLVFPDGRFDTGHSGIKFKMTNVNSTGSIESCVFRGRGFVSSSSDTRPDYTFSGSLGKFAISGSIFNTFRNFTANSNVALFDDVFLSGSNLYQSGAVITSCNVQRAVRNPSQSFLVSNAPGSITGCIFESLAGTNGHAIEVVLTGTYSFTNNTFTGYAGTAGSNLTASSGNSNAALYNNSGGLVTLNIVGGNSPSVRNGASATTVISNSVTITVTVKNSAGTAIQNARVAIFTDDASETELLNDLTNASGIVSTNYAYTATQPVFIRVRSASGNPAYYDVETSATITGSGLSVEVTMQQDTNVV
jgi:hypothetical protein